MTHPQHGSVYRGMGPSGISHRLGLGLLDKSGRSDDHIRVDPPAWSVVAVVRGRGTYTAADGRSWDLVPGSVFQRIPGHPQTTRIDPESQWLEVFVDLGPALHEPLATALVLPVDPPVVTGLLVPTRVRNFLRLRERLAATGNPGECYADIIAFARTLLQPAVPADDPIDLACQHFAHDLSGRVDVRAYCLRSGLDYDRFRRLFHQRIGLSPHQYRIRRRLEAACALLEDGCSVRAVAEQLGYSSPFEFSAHFRRHFGIPPSRRELRG